MKVKETLCGICSCAIKENTLFSTLTEAELDAFKDIVKTSFFKKKEMVFMEGDECKGLYVIRVGRVKLLSASKDGREHIIKILGPGDILGLEVFYDGENYAHTAVAMDDADLCFMDTKGFFNIIKKEPRVAVKIITALGRELNEAYKKIGTLGLLNAREKLAHLLYTLASEYGERTKDGVRLHLKFSRLELAEMLGITQETSIRLLKGFKEDGVIGIKKKEVIVLSMSKLAEIGGVEA